MKALSMLAVMMLATASQTHADEPAKPDPFVLPEGYSNARTATDPANPQPSTQAGELKSYSTLHSLGFEWDLGDSDTNHNAVCKVAYRRVDETTLHDALPLFRVDYYGWYADRKARSGYNMLAGSILFLRPGAEYLVKLSLADPDGGSVEREVKIATRPIPDYGTPTRTLHVMPEGKGSPIAAADGSQEKPFRGIEAAQKAAKPGDLVLLHAGDYGQAQFDRSGEPPAEKVGAQPKYIVWKGAGDGPDRFARALVTGSNLWFENLHFERAEEKIGLRANGESANCVVRANVFRGFSYSVFLDPKVRAWYIADNDIIGDDAGGIAGEGVELNHSSDHTVCYNRAMKTADGTSYCDTNCDIFGNDFFGYSDDGVEPDYGYANNRIWGNRLEGPTGITFQAMFCGPWYIVRNQIVSTTNVFKLRVQDRYLVANNLLVSVNRGVPHAQGLLTALSRNNLWIPIDTQTLWMVQVQMEEDKRKYIRSNVLFDTLRADWRTDVDYDAFDFSGLTVAKKNTPPSPFIWRGERILDLSSLAAQVGIERHARVVDKHKVFENFTPPPYDPAKRPMFTLRPEGEAVDVGVPLANVVEEFSGKAPDLGPIEAGTPPPHVGPRGDDWRAIHNQWVLKHQR